MLRTGSAASSPSTRRVWRNVARRRGANARSEARTQGAPIAVAIGATEDAASGRAARPGGSADISPNPPRRDRLNFAPLRPIFRAMRGGLPTLAVRQASAWLVHPWTRFWSVLGLGAAGVTVYVLLGDASPVKGPLYAAIAVLAATALAVSATLAPSRARWAWLLIATGQMCWAVGDVVWSAIDMTGGNPYPSAADVLYVTGYPLLAGGLALLLWSGARKVDWGDLVDVAIVTLASLLVLWPIVFQPALNEGWSWTTLTGISYSTGDVLLLGLLAALFFHGERRSPVIWLTAASLVLVFVADVIYYVPSFGATASAQTWSDSTWLAAYVLIAAAGIHPAERRIRRYSVDDESSPLRRLRFVGIALLTMPAAFAVEHLAGTGGTILGSSRTNPFKIDGGVERIKANLAELRRRRAGRHRRRGHARRGHQAVRPRRERRRRAEDDRQRPQRHRLHLRLRHRGQHRDGGDRPAAHHGRVAPPGARGRGDGPARRLDRPARRHRRRRQRRADPRAAVRHREGLRPTSRSASRATTRRSSWSPRGPSRSRAAT